MVNHHRLLTTAGILIWEQLQAFELSNIYPTRCNVTQFILSGNCSTCFGWYHQPSSGAQTTVSTDTRYCRYSCLRSWWWL